MKADREFGTQWEFQNFRHALSRILESYVQAHIVTQNHSFICISPSAPLEALKFYIRLKLYTLMIP